MLPTPVTPGVSETNQHVAPGHRQIANSAVEMSTTFASTLRGGSAVTVTVSVTAPTFNTSGIVRTSVPVSVMFSCVTTKALGRRGDLVPLRERGELCSPTYCLGGETDAVVKVDKDDLDVRHDQSGRSPSCPSVLWNWLRKCCRSQNQKQTSGIVVTLERLRLASIDVADRRSVRRLQPESGLRLKMVKWRDGLNQEDYNLLGIVLPNVRFANA
jgi:hypothetical protein